MLWASFWLVLCLASPVTAQTVLTWEDLQPSENTLVNPYAHLSLEQTYDLTTVARLQTWVEENQAAPDSLEVRELARLNRKLREQNLDVPTLLSQADEAQTYWDQQSQSTNSRLTGAAVQLSGYMLPLTWNAENRITEFLLVPYVGACIHVPPPPPNQIVYIRPAQALTAIGVFTPVTVEGLLQAQAASYELFRVDGSRSVAVSYALTLDELTFSETASESMAPRLLTGQDWSWWQRVQVHASAVLTQAVGTVHLQRSPQTFVWGMLIAFSYGVLHTLGPGHGKAVIVAYFVGQGGSLRRGISMGVRIAVFHVLSAIGVVLVTTWVLRQSVPENYRVVQLVSYGAIAVTGGWMLWRAVPWRHQVKSSPDSVETDKAEEMLYPRLMQQMQSPDIENCGCLTCVEPKRASDWLSLAIGSVPCSGALLILLYGTANDWLWPSVVMVIAISVGMAITLAWIGGLALVGRHYADRRIARGRKFGARHYDHLQRWVRFAGAGCVLALGLFGLTLVAL